MENQASPRNQLTPALGAIVLLVGGAWIASQGALFTASAESTSKFFGSWFHLVRSLPVLISLWIGAIGLGAPLRLWLAPHAKHWLIIQAAAGWGALLMLDWLAAWFGVLNGWTAWGFCGLGLAVWTYHFADPVQRQRWHPDNWPSPPWTLLLGLPAVGLLLIVCSCPPGTLWSMEGFGYDVTTYHLQVPREWLAIGGMTSLKHNVYSHLPLFNEAGYMQVAAMQGSMFAGIYTTQLLHASLALFAAIAIAKMISSVAGPAAGVFGGITLLVMPWTVITGSLAYNEMFVLAFGAAALLIVFDDRMRTRGGAIMLGVLLGCAVLSKLTAGGMIALPIVFIMALQLRPRGGDSTNGEAEAKAATVNAADTGNHEKPAFFMGMLLLAALLTVTPYLIRNTIWTGNPVFPFATSVFGLGHWEQENADRWHEAHQSRGVAAGMADLPRQWLLNTGYGAVLGGEVDTQKITGVAHFQTEYGIPVFWLLAIAGCVMGVRNERSRSLAWGMLVMLVCQLAFWVFATHHQSRFLVPTLIPGCIWIGMLFHQTSLWMQKRSKPILHELLATAIVFLFTSTLFSVAWAQSRVDVLPDGSGYFRPPLWYWSDSLIDPNDVTVNQPGRRVGRHPLNLLIKPNRELDKVMQPGVVLIVPSGGQLLYIHRPFIYSTPFDRSPLAHALKHYDGEVPPVAAELLRNQITHVWISFGEYERLVQSYGLDENMTRLKIAQLITFAGAVQWPFNVPPAEMSKRLKIWVDGGEMPAPWALVDLREIVNRIRKAAELKPQTNQSEDK